MAEIIIPVGFGNAVLKWTNIPTARTFTTTIGYIKDSGSSQTAQDSADAVEGAAVATGSICDSAQMNTQWRFEGVTVYQHDAGGVVLAASSNGPVTGVHADSGDELPNNIAIVAKKRTPYIGRRFRGRMYLPPLKLTSAFVGPAGNIEGARLTSIQSNVNVFLADMIASIVNPYLLHSHPDDAPTLINALPLATTIGTQRRRIR